MRYGIGVMCLLWGMAASGQETRGMIHGRVLDPSGTPVAGASVVVTNTGTNTVSRLTTNETGYYEANLLLPGGYEVAAEAQGFKKALRKGLVLPLNARLEIDMRLELGTISETVSVTAQAPLLDTSTSSSGMVLDNRSVLDLPVIADNTMVLVKLTPGIQTSGVNDYLGPHSNAGASDYSTAGGVGGNEWSIDGAPNNGAGRRSAYLPHSDTVQEMKVETSGFDASFGHTSGVSVLMMTRAGTNDWHGSATEQHWQQRWHGTPFFTRQLYYRNIAAAEASGDKALADRLRSEDKQQPGRSNNWAATFGGPVRIPKLYNGKDKLFFFFSYQGNIDKISDLPSRLNKTIATLDDRKGDFSRHLKVNAGLYQIYDPLSVRPDPARPRNFIRDPIPGNILPASRIQNPGYKFFTGILPGPNNDPDPAKEPLNNYLAITTPLLRDYKAYTNRMDYHFSDRHRFFGRWTYNDWVNDALDWTYDTLRGLQSSKQSRTNLAGTVDWVWTISSATVLDVAVAVNNYREGSKAEVPLQFKPSDVGLPKYLDDKAADQHILPQMTITGYETISQLYPNYTHFRSATAKADLSQVRGNHTLRAGFDGRGQYRTGGGGGNTSGTFTFNNLYTRRNDDNLTPAGNLAHSWAAFMMGLPSGISIATNDSFVLLNPYYGWYAQDNWRLTRKLSVNAGLRVEYEQGPTERYNRVIGYFDPKASLPITVPAQAAYAQSPIPELPAAQFMVAGGTIYPGTAGAPRRLWRNELMWLPRAAFAWEVHPKTVVRGGYGLFYDTLNVLNDAPDQTGFSRSTNTILTNDFGVNWLAGDPRRGISPMTDPFPVRPDGTRFDEPVRNSLGLMARAGRGWTYDDYNVRHARQQRWRMGVQRQIGDDVLIDIGYAGSYANRVPLARVEAALAEEFWAAGQLRDNAVASNMNSNVTNPFSLTNFEELRRTNPGVYQDMATVAYFTSPTIRRERLLRPYPQMNGLTNSLVNSGEVKTHSIELMVQRRFSRGFNLNFSYTRMWDRTADFYSNEFDALPAWRESNESRPHRVTATGIYEFPFGKGRRWLRSGVLNHIFGGFQAAATFEWQPGPLISFPNLFYTGDLANIDTGQRTLDRWFNTDGFEKRSAFQPAAFHRRVFPTRIDGLRRDSTNQWNVNLQRNFRLQERVTLELRADALNIQNRTQFSDPNTTPTSTDFGRVTAQTNTRNRFIQVQGRVRF
jgi:hypothetical protein